LLEKNLMLVWMLSK
jgi:hypothetical protein